VRGHRRCKNGVGWGAPLTVSQERLEAAHVSSEKNKNKWGRAWSSEISFFLSFFVCACFQADARKRSRPFARARQGAWLLGVGGWVGCCLLTSELLQKPITVAAIMSGPLTTAESFTHEEDVDEDFDEELSDSEVGVTGRAGAAGAGSSAPGVLTGADSDDEDDGDETDVIKEEATLRQGWLMKRSKNRMVGCEPGRYLLTWHDTGLEEALVCPPQVASVSVQGRGGDCPTPLLASVLLRVLWGWVNRSTRHSRSSRCRMRRHSRCSSTRTVCSSS